MINQTSNDSEQKAPVFSNVILIYSSFYGAVKTSQKMKSNNSSLTLSLLAFFKSTSSDYKGHEFKVLIIKVKSRLR